MHLLCGLPCCVLGVVFGSTMPKKKKSFCSQSLLFFKHELVAFFLVTVGCFSFLLCLPLPSVSSCAQGALGGNFVAV